MKIIFLLFFCFKAHAYVISKGDAGTNLRWAKQDSRIAIYVNPIPIGNNTTGITSTEVMSIFQESIDEWNLYSPFELVPSYTTNLTDKKNTVQFSNDYTIFGSGVLAITEVNYSAKSGIISSADIFLNESFKNSSIKFTDNETESSHLKAYLGDIFTHELGHFLGLSHSEVIGSSMIYSVFKNQHTLHSDDYHGVWDNYDKKVYAGEIKGDVLGGQSIEIFSANVFLIETQSMKVVQSQLTNEQGKFHFKNVDKDGSYILYTAPVKRLVDISEYYSTAIFSYCSKGAPYKTSFYTHCGPRSASRPQGFIFDDEDVLDVGSITIRCDENLEPNYLANKYETEDRANSLVNSYEKTSFIFSGIFTNNEISDGLASLGDEFEIDLRSINVDNPQIYTLKLDLISSGIGSAFDFYVLVKREDQGGFVGYLASEDETGKTLTDQTINLSLSSDPNNNRFTVKIYPMELSSTEKYEIFSVTSTLSNANALYLISAQLGSYSNDKFYAYEKFGENYLDDNSLCLEGNLTYTTEAYTPLSSNAVQKLDVDQNGPVGVSCATIDIDQSGGPPTSSLFSFIVGLLFAFSFRRLSRDNFV